MANCCEKHFLRILCVTLCQSEVFFTQLYQQVFCLVSRETAGDDEAWYSASSDVEDVRDQRRLGDTQATFFECRENSALSDKEMLALFLMTSFLDWMLREMPSASKRLLAGGVLEDLCSSDLEDCWTEELSSSDDEGFTLEGVGQAPAGLSSSGLRLRTGGVGHLLLVGETRERG
eukprot:4283090-Amphidinium_carterae.1